MRKLIRKIPWLAAVTMIAAMGAAQAAVNPKGVVSTSTNVLQSMAQSAANNQGIPPYVLKNAKGIAIIPNVTKAGFLVTGQHGVGVLAEHQSGGDWSDPVFISFSGGGIGFQAGAQSSDVILVFMNDRDLQNALNGSFTLKGNGDVTAGPVGSQGQSGKLSDGVYTYTRSGGVFAGVALTGSTLNVEEDANHDYYGKTVSAQDIIAGNNQVQPPADAQQLKQALQHATQGNGTGTG